MGTSSADSLNDTSWLHSAYPVLTRSNKKLTDLKVADAESVSAH